MDLAQALMVETTQEANLSNSSNVIFVKVLNNVSVAHIVPKTFKTPIVGFTYWPPLFPSHVNWTSHWCWKPSLPIIWKITRSSWSMSFKISSSLEDEVESSLFEKLEKDISQSLKWKHEVMKTRGEKRRKTSSLYSPRGNLNLDFKY